MKKALLLLAASLPVLAQNQANIFTLIPGSTRTTPGELHFRDIQATTHYVGFKSSSSNAANLIWQLPNVDGAAGKCIGWSAALTLAWESCSGGFTNPMTTLGDIVYEDATPTAARLAGNTIATRKFLRQLGTGSASAVPAWDTLVSGDIPSLSSLYCALTGCTMTGSILVGATINLGSPSAFFSTAYLADVVTPLIGFESSGTNVINMGTTGSSDVVMNTSVWGVLMDWNIFGTITIGNSSHAVDLVPAVTNIEPLGGPSLLWSEVYTQALEIAGISGSTQCLQVDSSGLVSGTGSGCASGSFLPLSGGTMTGSIFRSAGGTIDLGAVGTPWSTVWATNVGLSGVMTFLFGGTPEADLGLDLGTGAIYFNNLVLGNHIFSFELIGGGTSYGNLVPSVTNTYNLGSSSLYWQNLYAEFITASGAATFNGGLATASGTNSVVYIGTGGNFYNRTFSGTPSCSGVADGWAGYDTGSNTLWICNGGVAMAH